MLPWCGNTRILSVWCTSHIFLPSLGNSFPSSYLSIIFLFVLSPFYNVILFYFHLSFLEFNFMLLCYLLFGILFLAFFNTDPICFRTYARFSWLYLVIFLYVGVWFFSFVLSSYFGRPSKHIKLASSQPFLELYLYQFM